MPDDTDQYVMGPSGHRMYVDPVDERARELIRADGTLTPGSNRLWDAALALEPWDVVVDIGANYGEMVLGAEVASAARIICFEPNPQVCPSCAARSRSPGSGSTCGRSRSALRRPRRRS